MRISEADKQKIIGDMCRMIQCRTVSNLDDSLVDWEEFEKFRALLRESFPIVYKNCEFRRIGKSGIMHKISGTSGDSKHAAVLMAHYDVVPADGAGWSFDPFAGDVVDGMIRGRGAMDTKGTLCACLEAVELSLKNGWRPVKDLYLCFSGEEEINGSSCSEIVDWFKNNGITVDFVLDEGGAIVENAFPGVKKRCAMVGTAEKGSVYMDGIGRGKPGHASAPPVNSSVGLASKAVCRIEKKACKAEYTESVKKLFKVMGPNNSIAALKFLFGNLWCTKPLINLASKILGGDLFALLHTTTAVTKFEGSPSYNVLPLEARVGINLRLLGSDSIEKAESRILSHAKKAVGKNAEVRVEVTNGSNPSRESDTGCPEWKMLCDVIHETWPDILISPYMMMACSDSRHYCRITDKVYRFSGMFMSREDRNMIHGIDERISCETLVKTVDFYLNLLARI